MNMHETSYRVGNLVMHAVSDQFQFKMFKKIELAIYDSSDGWHKITEKMYDDLNTYVRFQVRDQVWNILKRNGKELEF